MGKLFTKQSVRENHVRKVNEILSQGGGPEEIANYIMSRIGTVISYERKKHERQLMAQRSNQSEKELGRSGWVQ